MSVGVEGGVLSMSGVQRAGSVCVFGDRGRCVSVYKEGDVYTSSSKLHAAS